MSAILDKVHDDFIGLFSEEKKGEADILFRKTVPAYDDISLVSNRKLLNFNRLCEDNGFTSLVKDLYSNGFVLANADCEINEAYIDSLMKDYLEKFYEANMQDSAEAEFSIKNFKIDRSFQSKIRDAYCLSVIKSYRKSLSFDEMIYIGRDKVLHVFRRQR